MFNSTNRVKILLPLFLFLLMACDCSGEAAQQVIEYVAPPPLEDCSQFAFLQPSEFVNDGPQVIAWNRMVGTDHYTITIYDAVQGYEMADYRANAEVFSIQRNISRAQIAGGDTLRIVIEAYDGNFDFSSNVLCSREIIVERVKKAQAPQPGQNALQARPDCAAFQLTSPTGGLPNGGVTFYWNPIPAASSYTITVLEGGSALASWTAGAGANSVSGNVSSGAIGGGFTLTVRATAHLTGGGICTSQATMNRESTPNNGGGDNGGGNNGGGNPQPTAVQPTAVPPTPMPTEIPPPR